MIYFSLPNDQTEERAIGHLDEADPPADQLAQALAEGQTSYQDISRALSGRRPATQVLKAFIDTVYQPPPQGVSERQLHRGAALFQRYGFLSNLGLALYGLPLAYLSPAGVKPLVFSGRLLEQAPRRLAETNRFLFEVCRPGGLRAGARGAVAIAHVRLMHAVMRARLLADPSWESAWRMPINQLHLASTRLVFSLHGITALEQLGARPDEEEVEDYLALWDWIGLRLGCCDALRTPSRASAETLWAMIRRVEGPCSDEGIALTKALLESAIPHMLGSLSPLSLERVSFIAQLRALSAWLLGAEDAAALSLPWRADPPALGVLISTVLRGADRVAARGPWERAALSAFGALINGELATRALGGTRAVFRV